MNTKVKFGAKTAMNVVSIAKTFSTRQEEYFLNEVFAANPRAHQYLTIITPNK